MPNLSVDPEELLDREVDYCGEEFSVESLEATIGEERRQQNENVETLDNLRSRNSEIQEDLSTEVDKLKELTDQLSRERERGEFGSRLREVLSALPWVGDQILTRQSIEQLLREQYEISARRVKEASEFADRLQVARADLYDEIERLNDKIVNSSKNEELAAERVYELTDLEEQLQEAIDGAEAGSTHHRELQSLLDRTRRQLAEESTRLKLFATAEERLTDLQDNTRQLAETISNLEQDITAYVTAAGEKLDLVSNQIQAIGAAADASTVMLEMKQSLDALNESVNHTTQFVSETQTYMRQNVDQMIRDLELYDEETEQKLAHNLVLSEAVDDLEIADAVSEALDGREQGDGEVTLEEVKEATIHDLEAMEVDEAEPDEKVVLDVEPAREKTTE